MNMKNLEAQMEKEITQIGKDEKLSTAATEAKYKEFEKNVGKYSEMIPKAENLERELELLDGKDTKDDDFIGQVDKLNKAMDESKAMV